MEKTFKERQSKRKRIKNSWKTGRKDNEINKKRDKKKLNER